MQFEVDFINLIDKNTCYLTGRCFNGDISLNSYFRRVYQHTEQYKSAKISEIYSLIFDEKYKLIGDIALRVERIEAYRHNLDELSSGMTGKLWLIGDSDLVIPRCLLAG